jgi:flagellar biosynthesis/type III secretory pathway chaperone
MASGSGSAAAIKWRQGKRLHKETREAYEQENDTLRSIDRVEKELMLEAISGQMGGTKELDEMIAERNSLYKKLDSLEGEKRIEWHARAIVGPRSSKEELVGRALEAEEREIEMEARGRTIKGTALVKGRAETDPTFLTVLDGHIKKIRAEREAARKAAPPPASAPVEEAEPAKAAGGAGAWAGPGSRTMFDKKFTEEDASDKWEMKGARKALVVPASVASVASVAAVSDGSWRSSWRSSAAPATTASAPSASPSVAPVVHRAAGVLPKELDAILRGYPVVYKPVGGDTFRVEFFNKKIEAIAGGRSPHQVQPVKDDVKAKLMADLAGKVTISEAPRGFVFDFTV